MNNKIEERPEIIRFLSFQNDDFLKIQTPIFLEETNQKGNKLRER